MRKGFWVESRYYLGHGLGNDYLVFEAAGAEAEGAMDRWLLGAERVRAICRRGTGVGSDGIVLLLDRAPSDGVFPLRMFNPDGSEFERSGNGLRVLGSHLLREGLVGEGTFEVTTGGSRVRMEAHGRTPEGEFDLSVELGRARHGEGAGILDLSLAEAAAAPFFRLHHPERGPIEFVPVWVGNPHAVVFTDDDSPRAVAEIGSFLTAHPAFPEGTNVQLVKVVGATSEDPRAARLHIGIWERGVGSTTASGTSSCAAAVATVAAGRARPGKFVVEMEGGTLEVNVSPEMELTLRGPVREVAEGRLSSGFLRSLRSLRDP